MCEPVLAVLGGLGRGGPSSSGLPTGLCHGWQYCDRNQALDLNVTVVESSVSTQQSASRLAFWIFALQHGTEFGLGVQEVVSAHQSMCCLCWHCAVLSCRPAEDRKGVKEALVEMTKTARAAVRSSSS